MLNVCARLPHYFGVEFRQRLAHVIEALKRARLIAVLNAFSATKESALQGFAQRREFDDGHRINSANPCAAPAKRSHALRCAPISVRPARVPAFDRPDIASHVP